MSILLDTTLHDLYMLDTDGAHHGVITTYPYPCQAERETPNPFSSEHFLYGITFPNTTVSNNMQIILECGIAQRYSFITGHAPVILFDSLPPITPPSAQESFQSSPIIDILTLYSQLHPSQRPQVHFPRNASEIHLPPNTRIAIIVPQVELAHLPHIVAPETHGHPLPFVVKVSIAVSGRGTFLIRTEPDRRAACTRLRAIFTPPSRTSPIAKTPTSSPSAWSCSRSSLPGEAYGLTFFVTQTGRAVFLAASRQQFNAEGQWRGGWVSFPAQRALRERYWSTITAIADELHACGYYGTVGADVMVDETGRQLVVDVNLRVTGSYHLGLLRGHFVRRGLVVVAVLSPLFVMGERRVFEERVAEEVAEGRLIVTAWVHGLRGGKGYAAVTLPGEDEAR
ncbi:putative solid-state culture specific protein [Aspergillus homomorphus CBS 101889]|uniref:ATP-grasp fold PylC-type domain-containing protein n=1 Tax=Aspergillus homomorphus (strain CBS 101889) TaxID=1450537 RepID=A0A395HTF3_ASPHC|nr:hypothetical protein BO97DRAFT_435508 [Aspergillus homomorphus CBS 101889]RAL11221.1 hypothetical protein BO97DRAFT_435508 [Aspergillus homomorphus CBS 101889]